MLPALRFAESSALFDVHVLEITVHTEEVGQYQLLVLGLAPQLTFDAGALVQNESGLSSGHLLLGLDAERGTAELDLKAIDHLALGRRIQFWLQFHYLLLLAL